MLRRNEHARQRWGGRHHALDQWLEERQELLVLYFQLAGLPPYSRDTESLPGTVEIKQFCQVLVDYVSSGHFEIFGQLIDDARTGDEKAGKLAEQVYPLIAVTTEHALNFNDNYADISETDDLPDFDSDLSQLGETLEIRMELEDKLLHTLAEITATAS